MAIAKSIKAEEASGQKMKSASFPYNVFCHSSAFSSYWEIKHGIEGRSLRKS